MQHDEQYKIIFYGGNFKLKNINIKLIAIITAAIAAIILVIMFVPYFVENKAITFEEQIEAAKSDISVQEKRRADLIPKLIDCVKDYDEHEYKTLMNVVSGRNMNSDTDVNDIETMINAVSESYPELKSDGNYKNLMNELTTTENLIANHRSSLNSTIKRYRQYVRKSLIKKILNSTGYKIIDYGYLEFDAEEYT